MTGHKLRKSYKNSQELFIKKKGKGAKKTRAYESQCFFHPWISQLRYFPQIF